MSERGATQQAPRLPSAWTLVRDILSFFGGWALVFTEVQRTELRESVLVFAAAVVGVPAAAVGAQTVADALAARRNGTVGPSSSPPEPAQSGSPSPPQ